ncbi:sterol desaturase family protein [bacterium M00.F.Ca.ET.141.01.1.1]|nr:sterol desaturase family protein [bacterium M00.F.Ca.ET.141.01.1.1]
MQLGLIGYYSDFVVYPLVIAVLGVAGLIEAGEEGAPDWIGMALICLGLWTLIEYVLHRFVLHHVPWIRDLHDRHHIEERSPVGTPTWLSLGVHALVAFLPVWMVSDFATASAVNCGLMLGYLWYISVHHMIHHWHPTHPSYLYMLKRRHAVHHHVDENANFGVTSIFWDRIFGTARL